VKRIAKDEERKKKVNKKEKKRCFSNTNKTPSYYKQ
jgi:hypothetical protein